MFSPIFRPGRVATTLAPILSLAVFALPASAQPSQESQRAQPLPHASTDGKVLGGMKKGADAAGRGIDRAGDATLNGVNRAAESASRPIRNFGNWLGGKLPKGPGGTSGQAGSKSEGS